MEVFHKKAIRPQACNFIKKETLAQVFSCEFCEIFKNTFFTEQLRTTTSYCSNLPKLASNLLEIFFLKVWLIFFWKRHYRIFIPKNWNIKIWIVCHSTEYLKLKWIDRRHFLGKRSVVILKIIYLLSKWFLEFSVLPAPSLKNNLHRRRFCSNFCMRHFPFRLKDCLCFQVIHRGVFRAISNIFQM